MEDKDSIIARLQNEVKSRDSDIYLAATYGKQLFEEKAKLSSKIDELFLQKELLEQEKHSLQLDLDTQIQVVKSHANELELQREQVDSLREKLQIYEKANVTLQKKNENLKKENLYLKKAQDDLNVKNNALNEKIKLLQKQISNFEDQAEKSLCETDKDENQELQAQLNTYMLNNKELQYALAQCQCELESIKKNENYLLQTVRELEETVAEKNIEISTDSEELKKAKEEIEELLGEIEVLKFDQIDVNKRGNSVFAELDDRRTLVEKEYKVLRKKYEQFQIDYEENKKDLDRIRGQMAILQSKASREYQQSYIDTLEDSLSSARQEINDLKHKLSKAIKSNEERSTVEQSFSEKNEYDYLRVMLQLSQKKEKELQSEVMNLKTVNIYDNDKLVKTQHLLYKTKDDLCNSKQEIFKLKQKIKELEQGIMHKLPVEPVTQPRIEILEGFKPLTTVQENPELLNKSIFNDLPDFDIIPGELELGEDGFRQVKPPRKSNRFILKEFNRIELDDEDCEKPSNSAAKKSELVAEKSTQQVTEEKNKCKSVPRSRLKHSNRRDDNCAQQ